MGSKVINTRKSAFTLIELSIVIVIIGLIIGAILVGQELIRNSRIVDSVSNLTKYNLNIVAFKDRFGYLPGDMPDADTKIASTATHNGNGDGKVSDNNNQIISFPSCLSALCGTATSNNELSFVWSQLFIAKLIDFRATGATGSLTPNTNFPSDKYSKSPIIFYTDTDNNNYFYIGAAAQTAATIAYSGSFKPEDAKAYDDKMDDGTPNTGNVQAKGGAAGNGAATVGSGITGCVDGPAITDRYFLASTEKACQLKIRVNAD